MNSSPRVSVMLPARDAARTLGEAARSCLRQSFEDLELVLIENDSTPGTLEVMHQLADEDSRVRILHSAPGAGFIAALNLGWRESRGEFLARMDSDDVSAPERIEKQVALLDSEPEIAACGSLVRIRRKLPSGEILPALDGFAEYEKWLNSVVGPEEIATQRFIDSPIANPCAMIRREVFDQIGGYREVSWAEDYDFWLRMLENDLRIAKVPEILLDWFDSETRLTRNDDHYSQTEFLTAKAHFLARIQSVRENGVAICGAGPIGKRLARLLQGEGITVHAFLEVSERRIGNKIAGVPVLGSDALPFSDPRVLVGAVGLPGARERIRGLLRPHGYVEGLNFFLVA